jgi:hypothetical protein
MIDRVFDRASVTAAQPEELKAVALRYADIGLQRMGELSEAVKAYTVREPARAICIAFGLGAFLGWMIKRR